MKMKFFLKGKMTGASMASFYTVFFIFLVLSLPAHAAVTQTAVVAMAAADYSSGAHTTVSVEPVGGPRTLQENLVPSGSDLTVVAYGKYFYRMERSGAQNVTKFDINSPATAIWQFSTEGSEIDTYAHDLVFASETKAYLLRNRSPILWIVNPSATTEAEFKIGEIDMSAYADEDGNPEMHSGVIVDGLLFITLQRFNPTVWPVTYSTPWVAVFDTTDDSEVDTGQGDGTRLGIPLPLENPGAIQYLEDNDTVYVQGTGQYTADASGIATINPSTYASALILDAADHAFGAISGMVIISPSKGYFVGYAGWGDNTLYSFNPSDADPIGTPISGLENLSIGGTETGAYLDQNRMLWVCTSTFTAASIVVLNTSDDSIDETIATSLVPLKVAFSQDDTDEIHASDPDNDSGCFIGNLIQQ
ncbi:MAG: hypothetical protein JRI91_07800 [Deltaproteobacteria bacterium]|nr:hypothetical protein [Deltaproteobacteria bacterium]